VAASASALAASASALDTSSASSASRGRYEWDDDVEEVEGGDGKRGEGSSWRALPVPLAPPTATTAAAALPASTTPSTAPLRPKVGEENGIASVRGGGGQEGVVKGGGAAMGVGLLQGRKDYSEEERRRLHIGSPGAVKADDNILEDWD